MKEQAEQGARWSAPLRGIGLAAIPWTMTGLLLAGAAAFLGRSAGPAHAAAVAAGNPADQDADGLPDLLEVAIGSSPTDVDTDGDGFSDAEELARRTSPTDSSDRPPQGPGSLSVGMSAYGEGGMLHIFCAAYSSDGSLQDKFFQFGAAVNGRLMSVPFAWLVQQHGVSVITGRTGDILLLDVALDPSVVAEGAEITWYFAVGTVGSGLEDADVVGVRKMDGVALLRRELAGAPGPGSSSAAVYVPIPVEGDGVVPPEWSAGRICHRTSGTVGANGQGLLIQEIISADCIDDWESYCSDRCPNAVGHTYTTIDPFVLIGG